MTIQEIAKNFPETLKLKTMGGQSEFTLTKENDKFTIYYSKNGEFEVTNEMFQLVYERYQSLPEYEQGMTSQYNQPAWKECPDLIACPYIARIVQYASM